MDKFGFSVGLGVLAIGMVLLYQAVFEANASGQVGEVISGALFFSLGLITVSLIVKNWWDWKRSLKDADRPVRK